MHYGHRYIAGVANLEDLFTKFLQVDRFGKVTGQPIRDIVLHVADRHPGATQGEWQQEEHHA